MVETNKTNLEFSRYGEINQDFEPAPISDNAKVVLDKRYLLKDDKDEIIETPNQMFIRVAKALAKPEKDYGLKNSEVIYGKPRIPSKLTNSYECWNWGRNFICMFCSTTN